MPPRSPALQTLTCTTCEPGRPVTSARALPRKRRVPRTSLSRVCVSVRRHADGTGFLRTLATASRDPGMLQPRFEPTDEIAGPVPNILGHDGDNYPSQIL